jgi:hypothetical protein
MSKETPPRDLLTSFVLLRYPDHGVVVVDAQDLDDCGLVGAQPADGFVQLLGLELDRFRHQRHDHVLEVAPQLALQLLDQVLRPVTTPDKPVGSKHPTYFAVHRFELGRDLLPLRITPVRQDLDDGILVRSQPLEGFFQSGGVRLGVEVGRGVDRRLRQTD